MSLHVAFQGEIGAYSEEAALGLFPDGQLIPCGSFEQVFETVQAGNADVGVVPIENSLHGSVHANYDLLREHDVVITGERHLRIRHHLLAPAGVGLADIREVRSHPQALGQCRQFLKTHLPHAAVVPAYDTAGAARLVSLEEGTSAAAIASASAADEYGLVTLASEIESNPNNYTRFLAICRPDAKHIPESAEGNSTDHQLTEVKTSVLYVPRTNIPGVLFKSLAVFALRDIDLFKIESRPLVGSPGEYIFYLDLAGSAEDEAVRNAIDHLGEIAAFVKVLGSYRQSPVGA